MKMIQIIPWILPLILIGFLIFRYRISNPTALPSFKWIYFILFSLGAMGVIIWKNDVIYGYSPSTAISDTLYSEPNIPKSEVQTSATISISPEIFAAMVIKNEDYISEELKKLGYDREKEESNIYKYPLHNEPKPSEYLLYNGKFANRILYCVENEEKYNSYFDTLLLLGAIKFNDSPYSNSKLLLKDSAAFLYKNAVFNRRRFISEWNSKTVMAYAMFVYDTSCFKLKRKPINESIENESGGIKYEQ